MFSTFTGNSRRPRNVNLSGQTGNPFANTAFSPSVVSSTTKAVSNAQADREKRQAEKQRVRAVARIQNTWRGHRVRRTLGEARRAEFDRLYDPTAATDTAQRLPLSFNLLLAFFENRRDDDLHRLSLFAREANTVDVRQIVPPGVHRSRLDRFVQVLVDALGRTILQGNADADAQLLLKLLTRIVSAAPLAISRSVNEYFSVLARLCQTESLPGDLSELLLEGLGAVLRAGRDGELKTQVYRSYAFHFLIGNDLLLFERNVDAFSKDVNAEALAAAILAGYTPESTSAASNDELLWLLAHFIHLGRVAVNSSEEFIFLKTLYTQLGALCSEISMRLGIKESTEPSEANGSGADSILQPLHPYVANQLTSLVNSSGITKLLQDFSKNLAGSSDREFEGTSFLAGYILALLHCFPGNADETRMRLFLEQIPTPNGKVPVVKFLWHIMRRTSVFRKLKLESERPVQILRDYLRTGSQPAISTVEEQEWRIILLFLELYVFILRLSDDEDFFSGIYPKMIDTDSPVTRIRSCSLSLEDIKSLSGFLKNTAFALHYNAREIGQTQKAIEDSAKTRLDSYLGTGGIFSDAAAPPRTETIVHASTTATRVGLDSLRGIITAALKMLYERDSRKHFLPADHWLMTSKLDHEGFVSAVVEEERQSRAEGEESDEESDSAAGGRFGIDSGFSTTITGQRLSRHARMERMRARQLHAQKERRMAELGPKLEILKHMPFVVPFETRVMIFRQFIQLDRKHRDGDSVFPIHPFARHHANIRRGQLFEDAYDKFYELGEGLKDPIQITFVDKFGAPEAGIDGGGVTKEFLTSVTTEAFGYKEGVSSMFTSNEQGLLYPSPYAVDALREAMRENRITEAEPEWVGSMSALLTRFEFLGRVIGKCLYEGILVDLAFAGFFLLKWASAGGANDERGYKGSINDLREMDEELYNGMLTVKNYPGDIAELGIDFTVTDQISPPGEPLKTTVRKLIPNGDQVYVTNDNRLLYINYVARHRLVVQPSLQTAAFLRGLRAIIRPSWLSMFNQSELQRLVGGDSAELDIEDLRRNTVYSGLYEIGDDMQEHPTIKLFWKVMGGFSDAQRRDVLKYVSSTPRAPLLGFSQLRPKFSIRDGGSDEFRLPSTSTCVNLLKLPQYKSESMLREKLLYAVTSGAGFDLS